MATGVTKVDLQIKKLYQSEYSAPDIATKLNLSLSRVYKSLRRQNVNRRDLSEQNRVRFNKVPLSFKFKEFLNQKDKQLLIAAVMLYYGEGAKTGHTVDFANSDPRALSVFIRFLRQICRVDEQRLRFYLYCFDGQDANRLIEFWARYLKVSTTSFTKPYVRKGSGNMSRVMPNGVLHIRYSDKRLLEKILFLIDEIANQFS